MDARLIRHEPSDGAWNMALDESLLASTAQRCETTLRLYSWQPATVSLGYFQAWEERESHDASRGLPCVRRHTGGGAIVHDDELTYCLVAPIKDRFAATDELLRVVHQTLIDVLADWGVSASLCTEEDHSGDQRPFLCFQRRAVNDLTVDRFKIAGSAQRRQRAAALLHGSILLGKSSFAPELPGLEQLVSGRFRREEFRESWCAKLAEKFKWQLYSAEVEEGERGAALRLLQKRYSRAAWNKRR